MVRKTFKEFIPEVTAQLKPMLDAFLSALGIRRGKEETRRIQKLQGMGRVTTGFLPEMIREVGEQFGMEETGFRAEHQEDILGKSMELFGLSEQWERQQAQIGAEKERQQAQIRSTEKLADLNRKLTQQGWSFQAREKELDRQLTKEGWDWQSRENILGRVFTAEQSALDRALSRELARLGGEGAEGITFPGIPSEIPSQPPDLPTLSTGLSDIAIGLAKRGAYVSPKKEVAPVIRKFKAEPSVYRKTYQPTQKATTTYRGTRLGRI